LPVQSSFQREAVSTTTSPTHIVTNCTSTPSLSSHPHRGWNSSHRYNTRFKQQHIANLTSIDNIDIFNEEIFTSYLASQEVYPHDHANSLHALQHLVYTASTTKDTLHFWEMQQDVDRSFFEEDMRHEISDLVDTSTVEVVSRSTVPPNNPPLQAIWSFRRKRAPDWSIWKYRYHVCPNGGMQVEGVNFWETYAPVVSWCTVCLTLILSLLSGLKSRQVDYVSAYTQAPLDCELFINIPPGFIVQNG
jgi:hypothetical protein